MTVRDFWLRKLLRLIWHEPQQFRLLLGLGWWVLLTSTLLRYCSLQRSLRLLTWRPAFAARTNVILPTQVAATLDQILRLDFWVFTPTCWKRAIVLHRFLALSGVATKIVFGVQRDGEKKLAGHAWLEHQGEPFLEAQPPDYVPTYCFPN